MNFFLRAKPWVLFIPLAIPLLTQFTLQGYYTSTLQDPTFAAEDLASALGNMGYFLVAVFALNLVSLIVTYGWMWSVGNHFHRYLPAGTKLNLKTFQITFLLGIACIILAMIGSIPLINSLADLVQATLNGEDFEGMMFRVISNVGLVVVICLFSFALSLYNAYFTAKTLKCVEEVRPAQGGEIVGYVLLIYLFVIGVWVLQPKVRRFMETGSMKEDLALDWK